MKKVIEKLGARSIIVIEDVGKLTLMLIESFFAIRKSRRYNKEIVEQFFNIGRRSLFIVLFTSVFIKLNKSDLATKIRSTKI